MMNENLKDKELTNEQMEDVAGGTYLDSIAVAQFLEKAGHANLTAGGKVNFSAMRDVIKKLGFTSQDHGGIIGRENTYTQDSTGEVFTQQQFMEHLHKTYPGVK